MRILIDITHPAHLHFFRHAVRQLTDQGHTVKLTGRDKDILVTLAAKYGFDIEIFGTAKKGSANLMSELLQRQWRLQKIIRKFKPDTMMAIAGTYIASLGWLFRIPTYVFYDTEHATLSNVLSYPFATCVYVPRPYLKSIRWRHERYDGYHELAYLHPTYFTPDPGVLDDVGLQKGEPFSIVRFVGWGAAHDQGVKGFSETDKVRAVHELHRFGRVFISCEGDMPEELETMRLNLDVSRIHDLTAFASLMFGESGTMTSEAAVLGVPSVYINPLSMGYIEEQQQKYGLVFGFRGAQFDQALEKAKAILNTSSQAEWRARADKLLDNTVDVTKMICDIATKQPFSNR